MTPIKPPWLSIAFFLSACISLPDIDTPHADVQVMAPNKTAYTNGTLELRLEITGTPPDKVELLADDEVLATLEPPYTYQWDTTAVLEGHYRVTGRVHVAGTVFTSEAREVVVDRTPLLVVSRTPVPDAKDVRVSQPIQAVFSEQVQFSSLSNESVRMALGSIAIPSTFSLSPDGKTLTVFPSSTLSVPNMVSMTLTTAVTDLAGNSIQGAPAIWRWTAPSLAPLGPPLSANAGATNAYEPRLELDATGNPFVAWVEHDGTAPNIYVSQWTGAAWRALGGGLRVGTGIFEADTPSLQLDRDGNPVVAWHEGYGTGDDDHVYVARWNGSQWVLIGGTSVNAATPSATSFAFKLDNSGKPVVALGFSHPSIADLWVYQWDGTYWQPLGSGVGTGGALSSLELNSVGRPIVAWTDYNGSVTRTCLREFTATNDWLPLGGPSADACPQVFGTGSYGLSIKFDSLGNLVATWIDNDDSDKLRRIRTYRWALQTWNPICGSPAIDATPDIGYLLLPRFHLDSLDNPWLAWSVTGSASPQFPHIWHCRSNTWTSVFEDDFTSSFPPGTALAGDLRIDRDRNIVFAISIDGNIQVYTSNK